MSHFLSPIFASGFFESEAVHIALGVGALVALVTGVVGVFTVIRGQSFAGEAFGDLGTTGGSGAYLVGRRDPVGVRAGQRGRGRRDGGDRRAASTRARPCDRDRARWRDRARGAVPASLHHPAQHHRGDGHDPVRVGVRDLQHDDPADPGSQRRRAGDHAHASAGRCCSARSAPRWHRRAGSPCGSWACSTCWRSRSPRRSRRSRSARSSRRP